MSLASTPSKFGAPALARGLTILELLGNQAESLSLEVIAQKVGFPKASVFRLLETLAQLDLVEKTAGKEYQALWVLRPAQSAELHFEKKLARVMQSLVSDTGCTAEWYTSYPAGMTIRERLDPDREVCVMAKLGFLRDWTTELECVSTLGHAFSPDAQPFPKKARFYRKNGESSSILKQEAMERISQARATSFAHDLAYNTNSVRRYAVAIHSQETFQGILALADSYSVQKKPKLAFYHTALQEAAAQLNKH